MGLFDVGERVVEELSLAEMLPKLGRVQALLHGYDLFGIFHIGTLGCCGCRNDRLSVREVVNLSFGDSVAFLSVPVVVQDRADGAVDRNFLPIYS